MEEGQSCIAAFLVTGYKRDGWIPIFRSCHAHMFSIETLTRIALHSSAEQRGEWVGWSVATWYVVALKQQVEN